MSGPLKDGRAWSWFLCAAGMYLAILAVTWAPDKGPNTVDLVPFRNEVRAIGAWQRGHLARRAFSELALNVQQQVGKRSEAASLAPLRHVPYDQRCAVSWWADPSEH
jgi:hypothetical protein